MKLNNSKKLALMLAIAGAGSVYAQNDDIKFSAGLKAWNHGLSVKSTQANDTYQANSSFKATSPLISLTAKKGDFFIAFSTLMETVYAMQYSNMKRSDTDLAVGWSFHPGYSALIGHKTITTQDWDDKKNNWLTSDKRDAGYFFGVTGAQALQDRWFAYESFIYGPKLKSSNDSTSNVTFSTLEVGMGYAHDPKTQFTLGYRNQVRNKTNDGVSGESKATLDGIIFGVSHNF